MAGYSIEKFEVEAPIRDSLAGDPEAHGHTE